MDRIIKKPKASNPLLITTKYIKFVLHYKLLAIKIKNYYLTVISSVVYRSLIKLY